METCPKPNCEGEMKFLGSDNSGIVQFGKCSVCGVVEGKLWDLTSKPKTERGYVADPYREILRREIEQTRVSVEVAKRDKTINREVQCRNVLDVLLHVYHLYVAVQKQPNTCGDLK